MKSAKFPPNSYHSIHPPGMGRYPFPYNMLKDSSLQFRQTSGKVSKPFFIFHIHILRISITNNTITNNPREIKQKIFSSLSKMPKESPAFISFSTLQAGANRLHRFDLFKTTEIADRFFLCFIYRSGVIGTALRYFKKRN